jgi:hypothetical protein
MTNINHRKRAAYRRRVQATLQRILNDPTVMPNADCPDLVVSVSRVEFGRTIREIYIDVLGEWRRSRDQWTENPHDRYTREAQAKGEETYADLTEVFMFPSLTEIVARELQKQLGLLYTPIIRRLCDLGGRWREDAEPEAPADGPSKSS